MTRHDKRSMMLALVNQWQQSGLSQAEFSRVQNIKTVQLRYWIRKLRQHDFPGSGFIQLSQISSSGFSIRYPNGVELILPVQVPARYLKMLISISV